MVPIRTPSITEFGRRNCAEAALPRCGIITQAATAAARPRKTRRGKESEKRLVFMRRLRANGRVKRMIAGLRAKREAAPSGSRRGVRVDVPFQKIPPQKTLFLLHRLGHRLQQLPSKRQAVLGRG